MPSLNTRKSLPVVDESGKAKSHQSSSLWRSLEERLRGGPERAAAAAEFPHGAAELDGTTSRRTVLQLLGASAALAGLEACVRRPRETLVPYTRQPEGVTPGNALHFATSTQLGGVATGLLVTSWEGRPTKVDGNPDHPASLGGSGLHQQASILGLYDPNRASVIKYKGQARSLQGFFRAMLDKANELKGKNGGAGLAFLSEPTSSPLLESLRGRIQKELPQARFYGWSALGSDGADQAAHTAFGGPTDVRGDLSKAKVIVSLDADVLSSLPGTLHLQRQFADGRVPVHGREMNRLYVVETQLTPTGASSDHRLAARPSEIPQIALALLAAVAKAKGGALGQFANVSAQLRPEQQKFVAAMAKDLAAAGAEVAVLAGPRQPAAVHLAAHALNAGLGSEAVKTSKSVLLDTASGNRSLQQLAAEIDAGKIDTLIVTSHNPVFGAPSDLNVAQLLAKVPNVVYLGAYEDETAPSAAWFVPAAHELEAWGDGRAFDGTITLQQPLIQPLFNGLTAAEVYAALLGEGEKGSYGLLRDFWTSKGVTGPQWEKWVSDGLATGSAQPAAAATPNYGAIAGELAKVKAPAQSALEVSYALDLKVLDGRFANNAWLQELPEPITRLVWENAVLLAPATAKRLGVDTGDVIDVSVKGRTVRGPVLVQPGQALDTVGLTLGYGRTSAAEQLASGLGFDANKLRTVAAAWGDSDAQVSKTGDTHKIVQTQEHHSMEGRALAMMMPKEKFEKEGKEEIEALRSPLPTLHEPVKYEGYQWAMAIDLGRCTGCNACVIACQSENNIPVVGKDNVGRSREMHWLRIDRYFTGDENAPEVVAQPVMCVHCETAPCEYVCPVNATVHSDEGLNDMVYNRCVGTRYCSNNCPYKVRRFNFFSYTSDYSDVEKMRHNPDVTVRARGVMEKCTYCVQRIERARISTRVAGTSIKDGDVVTACQQACPSNAIVFGSLDQATNKVAQLHKDERRYDLLHELGTRPRTAYLTRLKNPNPELA